MKNFIKLFLFGICEGCTIFVIIGVIFDIIYKGEFQLSNWQFTKMAIGAAAVGIGYCLPSVIYKSDKLSMPHKTIIHLGIGSTIFLIVSFLVGWIPFQYGVMACVIWIAVELGIAVIIWLGFYFHHLRQAKVINAKIKAKQH